MATEPGGVLETVMAMTNATTVIKFSGIYAVADYSDAKDWKWLAAWRQQHKTTSHELMQL